MNHNDLPGIDGHNDLRCYSWGIEEGHSVHLRYRWILRSKLSRYITYPIGCHNVFLPHGVTIQTHRLSRADLIKPNPAGADMLASQGFHVFVPDLMKGGNLDFKSFLTMDPKEKYVDDLPITSRSFTCHVREITSTQNDRLAKSPGYHRSTTTILMMRLKRDLWHSAYSHFFP